MMGIAIMTAIALVVVLLGWPADPGERVGGQAALLQRLRCALWFT